MTKHTRTLSRVLLVVMVAMPLLLLVSSLRTLRELEKQKTVYLRSRVAILSGRLESLPAGSDELAVYEALAGEEPSLVDLEIVDRNSAASSPALEAIWAGRELYRMESVSSPEGPIYRAWVPFHSRAGLRVARMDLDAHAADFLVIHARHNVIAAALGSLAVVLIALYAIRAARQAAGLRVRQLEMEHLAHIGGMSAVLAHEIRNPLGTIKGFAQLARERAGEDQQALLDPILDETRRLEHLVSDLLLYGRPPAPVLRLAKWEETRAILAAHAREMIGARDIGFHAEPAEAAWKTDPPLLQQALLNLLRNAVEAVGERPGGEVRLELRREPKGGLSVAVVDNGPGIPEETTGKLFDPFFTTKAFGTGLGLPITRRLAKSLGGELTLGAASPRGTEALLRFPGVLPC